MLVLIEQYFHLYDADPNQDWIEHDRSREDRKHEGLLLLVGQECSRHLTYVHRLKNLSLIFIILPTF